jgi:hypothetical protein
MAGKKEALVLPEANADFSTSGVVLSRQAAKYASAAQGGVDVLSQQGVQIRPFPSRQFRATENLIIFFELYNAAINSEMGKPLVRVTVTLLKEGGPVTRPMDYVLTETLTQPVPHLIFAKFISLAGLTPGNYTAAIEAKDTVTHKLVTQQVPFVIKQ